MFKYFKQLLLLLVFPLFLYTDYFSNSCKKYKKVITFPLLFLFPYTHTDSVCSIATASFVRGAPVQRQSLQQVFHYHNYFATDLLYI